MKSDICAGEARYTAQDHHNPLPPSTSRRTPAQTPPVCALQRCQQQPHCGAPALLPPSRQGPCATSHHTTPPRQHQPRIYNVKRARDVATSGTLDAAANKGGSQSLTPTAARQQRPWGTVTAQPLVNRRILGVVHPCRQKHSRPTGLDSRARLNKLAFLPMMSRVVYDGAGAQRKWMQIANQGCGMRVVVPSSHPNCPHPPKVYKQHRLRNAHSQQPYRAATNHTNIPWQPLLLPTTPRVHLSWSCTLPNNHKDRNKSSVEQAGWPVCVLQQHAPCHTCRATPS